MKKNNKRKRPPSQRCAASVMEEGEAMVGRCTDWPRREVRVAVLQGLLNALANFRRKTGFGIPPTASIFLPGQVVPELLHVPSDLEGGDLVYFLGRQTEEHSGSWSHYSYVTEKEQIATVAVFPTGFWAILGDMKDGKYQRLKMEYSGDGDERRRVMDEAWIEWERVIRYAVHLAEKDGTSLEGRIMAVKLAEKEEDSELMALTWDQCREVGGVPEQFEKMVAERPNAIQAVLIKNFGNTQKWFYGLVDRDGPMLQDGP